MKTLFKTIKRFLKIVSLSVLALLAIVVASLIFLFVTPEITVSTDQIARFATKYLPSDIALEFGHGQLQISRPSGLWFAKHISVETKNICFRYSVSAVDACFSDIRLGATGGWGGTLLKTEVWWMPRLIQLDPVIMKSGRVAVNLLAFPPKDPNEKPTNFSFVGFLRKQILPKWKIDGSRVELSDLNLKTSGETYRASFDLTTGETDEMLTALLHHFDSASGDLKTRAVIHVRRPPQWQAGQVRAVGTDQSWRVFANADLVLGASRRERKEFDLNADANIYDWENVDLRLTSFVKGITALQQVRAELGLKKSEVRGIVSLKAGRFSRNVKALDFVNCGIEANLDRKTAGVQCGPETVRLGLQERTLLQRPGLFTLAPNFDLKISNLEFGSSRSAEFSLLARLDHLGLVKLDLDLTGRVEQSEKNGLRYQLNADAQAQIPKFQNLVALLKATPFSIPAPLNGMSGAISLNAKAGYSQLGGEVSYVVNPSLVSQYQSLQLRLSGTTLLGSLSAGLHPKTLATLFVDELHLSLPRLDLALPPQLVPDSRFHKINLAKIEKTQAKKVNPLNLVLRIVTTKPEAIRLASSLTKNSIPIDIDLTYDANAPIETKAPPVLESGETLASSGASDGFRSGGSAVALGGPPEPGGARGPAGGGASYAGGTPVEGQAIAVPKPANAGTAALQGSVSIGSTKLDLFRRDATLEHLKIEFLPTGEERIDGRADVHYLEYDVAVLLSGDVDHPEVKFSSRPYLDDRQVVAVLLFGHEMSELNPDQKQSVAGLQAAAANAALGLGSLYLLAKTPVESIGYNPDTQSVTATVGLGGGAAVEVGTAQDFGFRKTLSRDFVFRSDVENLGTSNERTVSAMIEWVRGF